MQAIIQTIKNFGSAVIGFFSNIPNLICDFFVNCFNFLMGGIAEFISAWLVSLGLDPSIPPNVFNAINELTRSIGFIFPVAELMPIFEFSMAFYTAKLIFSIYSVIASTVIKKVQVSSK